MYELLPWWLKPGIVEWNKGTIEFSNGSKVYAAPTTSSSIRGYSINLLYCLSGESTIIVKDNDIIKETTFNELCGIIDNDNFFIDNKYSKIYWNLINKAKNRILDSNIKTENHHIFPKSIFGKNNLLVKLTLREHFFAHKLLVKMTKGKQKAKMVIAAFKMAHNIKNFILLPSCKYESLKNDFSQLMREKMTGSTRQNLHNKDPEKIKKTAEKHKGMKRTNETKKNISDAKKRFFEINGPESNGLGQCYVHHRVTKEIKRVTKDFILGSDWLPGYGYNKTKGNIWIYNTETKERKSVKPDFSFTLPWVRGWGPRK